MLGIIKRNRQKFTEESIGSDKRKYFSPISLSQYEITIPLILRNVKGNLIDVGCGDLHYKKYLESRVLNYDSIDIKRTSGKVTYEGDIQNMLMIKADTYDSAICLETLEHVPKPYIALKEIHRILKKNGILIISVPHLSRLHEVPFDFFRYTKYGLIAMLKEAGFYNINIIPRGGILTFIGHQISTLLISSSHGIPIVDSIGFILNKYIIVKPLWWLDKYLDKEKRLACGYTCIAIKE